MCFLGAEALRSLSPLNAVSGLTVCRVLLKALPKAAQQLEEVAEAALKMDFLQWREQKFLLRHVFVLCHLGSLEIQRPRVQEKLKKTLKMELQLSKSTACALFAAYSATGFDLKPLEMDLKPWQAALIFPGLANSTASAANSARVALKALEGLSDSNAAILALAALVADEKTLLLKALQRALEAEDFSDELRITLCYLRWELEDLPLPLLRLAGRACKQLQAS